MKQQCKSFKKYKAIFQPRCNCNACWTKYFDTHQMSVAAAKVGIDQFGEGNVRKVKGDKYVKFLLEYLKTHDVNI